MKLSRKPLVAVVDDEPDIRDLVALHLQQGGFSTETCADAGSLYDLLDSARPDLVILDLSLPDADGLDVCRYLKSSEELGDLPIIMLTARGDESDRILGLELGADDYVTKPFSPKELVSRVKAVMRRGSRSDPSPSSTVGDIVRIDAGRHEVWVEGERIDLTSTEFKIIQLLASKKGWVFTREQILDYLWGQEKSVIDRTVDVHIKHLRTKLGGRAAKFIRNIRGVGYKLEE